VATSSAAARGVEPAAARDPLAALRNLLLLTLFVGAPFLLATGRKAEAVGLIGLVAAGGCWITRRRGEHLLGPHFYFDLVRLARHKGLIRLRIAYALVLLGGLCFLYGRYFGRLDPWAMLFLPGPELKPNALAGFAESFAHTFFMLQIAAVLVLTPAYIGPAIAAERDKRGLDLLRCSPLSEREVVVGKLASRLVHLAGVLLTGLPILSLVQFFGGVDMNLLLAGFVVTGFTLLSVGGVTILVSSFSTTAWAAVLEAYVVTFFVMGCLFIGLAGFFAGTAGMSVSPLTMLLEWRDASERWGAVAIFGVLHGTIGVFAIFWAINHLRMERSAQRNGPEAAANVLRPRLEPTLPSASPPPRR